LNIPYGVESEYIKVQNYYQSYIFQKSITNMEWYKYQWRWI